jgi:hypothetical protein
MPVKRSFLGYLKPAFLWHWNLLAVGAGLILGFLSGQPDVVLPVLAAVEVGYLGLVSTNQRYRKAVDATNYSPGATGARNAEVLDRIRGVLAAREWARFESLRDRCAALNEIGQQLRSTTAEGESTFGDMRSEALDRLLWMFLKLLLSKNALDRFLATVDADDLKEQVVDCQGQLEKARAEKRNESLIRAMEDKLDTMRQRLANFDRARENRETVMAELDRVEQKIAAVSEGTLSSRDAGAIGAQVDGIAAGVSVADEAIRGLDVALPLQEDFVPGILWGGGAKEKA